MVHVFLAVVFFGVIEQRPPAVLAYFTSVEACHQQARRMNAMEPVLKGSDMKALGAEAVCLKVDRPVL
jgi:hypothetical protein